MSFNWDELDDIELMSSNEIKENSKFELPPVDDGTYQVEVIEISQRFDNKYAKPGQINDRRVITFVIVNSDDPDDIGKKFKQWYNVSSHPKSALYPLFKAAAGGQLDPEYKPRLSDLKNAQVRGSLVTKEDENGEERQVFESIMVAKKRFDAPPF
jgi:hypothetical protein